MNKNIMRIQLENEIVIDENTVITETMINDVYEFCKTAKMLRTGYNCSAFYKNKYSERECDIAINLLFNSNLMGAYYFEKNANPQKYMRQYILSTLPNINFESKILEIGPGNLPLFDEKDYSNWRGLDYNYSEDGFIYFSNQKWGGVYHNVHRGSWETISSVVDAKIDIKKYDLVCGSHSYEHTFKPITALKEAGKVLNQGGYLVLFVPDGFSTWGGNYDKTHTLYLVKEMVEEFFYYAGGYNLKTCEQFRINMDLVIVAQKI